MFTINISCIYTATKFQCPCRKCTLKKYLREGCRAVANSIPYLELSKLDEQDKEDLIQQLSQETKKIIGYFSDLIDSTCFSLKKRGVTTIELARRVLELGAYTSPSIVQKPLMSEEVNELKNSKTIAGSFLILQPHMSFFNFELLKHIIEGRQTGSDEDRKKMTDYHEKFVQYCKRRLVEVPQGAIGQSFTNLSAHKRCAVVILAHKSHPLCELSLEDVRIAKRDIATLLGLESSTLYLHKIDEGSLMFIFSVPEFVAQELFPLIPTLRATLRESGYFLFAIPDTNAANQDVTEGTF